MKAEKKVSTYKQCLQGTKLILGQLTQLGDPLHTNLGVRRTVWQWWTGRKCWLSRRWYTMASDRRWTFRMHSSPPLPHTHALHDGRLAKTCTPEKCTWLQTENRSRKLKPKTSDDNHDWVHKKQVSYTLNVTEFDANKIHLQVNPFPNSTCS